MKWGIGLSLCTLSLVAQAKHSDTNLWLEQVHSSKVRHWVSMQNARTMKALTQTPQYESVYNKILSIKRSDQALNVANVRGEYYYRLERSEQNPAGILLRSRVQHYLEGRPQWESVLDIGQISEREGTNWQYQDMQCRRPQFDLCLVYLSKNGGETWQGREFDLQKQQFIEGGFSLDDARSHAHWLDENRLLVATDFSDGQSFTESGYTRSVKLWKRGQPLSKAIPVYLASQKSVSVRPFVFFDKNERLQGVAETKGQFSTDFYLWESGQLKPLYTPKGARIKGIINGQVVVQLTSGFGGFLPGEVIYTSRQKLLQPNPDFRSLQKPKRGEAILAVHSAGSKVVTLTYASGCSEVRVFSLDNKRWTQTRFPCEPNTGIKLVDAASRSSDLLIHQAGFLSPDTLYHIDLDTMRKRQVAKVTPGFDASRFVITQLKARSKDGTDVPYYLVIAKHTEHSGQIPTLLYAYAGFGVPTLPFYSSILGVNWLEMGGAFALAHPRGGGEYGSTWHSAAMQKNRHKAFEDFEAVAEDLRVRKISSSQHLGIYGASNGGLLVFASTLRRPELYRAAIAQAPLADMRRYHKLFAGASWIDEFGHPDNPEDWEYMKRYSPYHNIVSSVKYPRLFVTASARDKRVHPGHARKMIARMNAMGHFPYYIETPDRGHLSHTGDHQAANLGALIYSYLYQQLF